MRRNLLALGLAAALALGACGGDDGNGSSSGTTAKSTESTKASDSGSTSSGDLKAVKDAKDCDALVKAAQPIVADAFQQLIDNAGDMSAEDLINAGSNPEDSALLNDFLSDFQEQGDAIQAKGDELGCTSDQLEKGLCGAIDQIDTKGSALAETMVSGMATEC